MFFKNLVYLRYMELAGSIIHKNNNKAELNKKKR